MRYAIAVCLCIIPLNGCGAPTDAGQTPSAGSSPAAAGSTSSKLAGADIKAKCGGFDAAQAAEILGVPAASVSAGGQDVTPTSRACEYRAGEKKIGFSINLEGSADDAKKALENMREAYVIAARAQEKSTGKEIKEGAYSDILDLGDEAIWSVTNQSLAVRRQHVTIIVMLPDDKRMQVAVARKILEHF